MQLAGYKTCFFELKYFINCSTEQHSITRVVISVKSQLAVLKASKCKIIKSKRSIKWQTD